MKRKYSWQELGEAFEKKKIDINAIRKKVRGNDDQIEITEGIFNNIPGMKESG